MYLATREEFSAQYFEGSSTLFGPWASAATLQELDQLAADLVADRAPMAGPLPRERALDAATKIPVAASGVPVDGRGAGFGAVLTEPRAEYAAERATVTVTFQGAHPRSVQELGAGGVLSRYYDPAAYSYLEIQRNDGSRWVTVRTDGDPYTAIDWADTSVLGNGVSTMSVTWLVRGEEPGIYRVVYNGVAKTAANAHEAFKGTSRQFTLK
jgi:neutral ceramidase